MRVVVKAMLGLPLLDGPITPDRIFSVITVKNGVTLSQTVRQGKSRTLASATAEIFLNVIGQTVFMSDAVAPQLPYKVVLGHDLPI